MELSLSCDIYANDGYNKVPQSKLPSEVTMSELNKISNIQEGTSELRAGGPPGSGTGGGGAVGTGIEDVSVKCLLIASTLYLACKYKKLITRKKE